MKTQFPRRFRKLSGALATAGVLLLPMLIYLWVFGTELSRDHQRWGEFGSAISGIYTPLLALLTLYVLFVQVRLQAGAHSHEKDRAYIEQARADMEFYIVRMDEILEKKIGGIGETYKHSLLSDFHRVEADDFSAGYLQSLAQKLDKNAPQILQLIFAMNLIFEGLSASDGALFRINYTAARQKMLAILGFDTCVALEHFHAVRTEGRVRSNYYFSPNLTSENDSLSLPSRPAAPSAPRAP